MDGEEVNVILDGWWSVFHQSTENLIIGMFTAPIIETILKIWSVVCCELKEDLRAISPMYWIKSINVEVILASQTQYLPHVGLPHIEPEIRTIAVKIKPRLIAEFRNIAEILVLKTR